MRRLLVVALLSSSLVAAVPRDGGGSWLNQFRAFVRHALHLIGGNGDGIVPPKP